MEEPLTVPPQASFPFRNLVSFIQVDINGIEAIDDGDFLPIPPSVDL